MTGCVQWRFSFSRPPNAFFMAPVVVVKTWVFTVGKWMMFSPMNRFGIMNPSKPGFHAFYPGPVAPRITYQGRWKYADPMQGFAWTENKGHLKNEYPGIGKVRAGHLLNEPRQQGATVLA